MLNQGDKIILPDTYYIVKKIEKQYIWFREKQRTNGRLYYHLCENGTGTSIVVSHKELQRMMIGERAYYDA